MIFNPELDEQDRGVVLAATYAYVAAYQDILAGEPNTAHHRDLQGYVDAGNNMRDTLLSRPNDQITLTGGQHALLLRGLRILLARMQRQFKPRGQQPEAERQRIKEAIAKVDAVFTKLQTCARVPG